MLNLIITSSSRYPIHRKQIKQIIEKVLTTMKISGQVEVEVSIIGDRKMTQLHEEFMHESGTTDVLSFPLQENYIFNRGNKASNFINPDQLLRLGSIVISYPVAQRQANEHNLLVDDEINRLIEHGMLHLLGIHHE